MKKIAFGFIIACALLAVGCLLFHPSPERRTEEIVSAKTKDSLLLSGLLITPGKSTENTAIVWVHGAGQNFYYPSYVEIGREMARQGYAFLTVNTRMHDIGNFLSYEGDVALRGGTYWGIPGKIPLDIAAWIDLAERSGYGKVILVGHSAGGPAVREYLAVTGDERVAGLVLASVAIGPAARSQDPDILPIARQMVAEGRGQELLPMIRVSAATYDDYSRTPDDIWDFYGSRPETPYPAGISRIRCPLLAWYGTDDVGDEQRLERLKQLIARQPDGPASVTTAILQGVDHLYDEHEKRIAGELISWVEKYVDQ